MRAPLVAASLLIATAAHADARLVIADLEGPRPAAPAVTLLLRSMLAEGPRPAVPTAELRQAAGGSVSVEVASASAKKLLETVKADRVVVGAVRNEGDRLILSYRVYNQAWDPLGAESIAGPAADADAVAADASKRIAALVGGKADDQASASIDALSPYVNADSAADPDAALRAADPAVAARLPEARAILSRIAESPAAPVRARVRAALIAADPKRAVSVAAGAKLDPGGQALLARAEIAAGDLSAARKLLAHAGSTPDAQIARGSLAAAEGKNAEAATLLSNGLAAAPDGAALSAAEKLPPGNAAVEVRLLDAARKLGPSAQARLIPRAIKSGVAAESAVAGLDLHLAPRTAVDAVAAALPAGTPAADQFGREAKARELAAPKPFQPVAAPVAPKASAPVAPAPAVTAAPVAPKPAPVAHQAGTEELAVAAAFEPLLATVPSLAERAGAHARIAPTGPPPGFGSRKLDEDLLGRGLATALSAEGRGLVVDRKDARVASPDALAHAGSPVDLAITWTASPTSRGAEVTLTVLDTAANRTESRSGVVNARLSGLIKADGVYWGLVAGLLVVLAVAGVLAFRFFTLVGDVRVHLRNELGSQKETFAIRITRSPEAPTVSNPVAFDKKERRRGPRTFLGHRSLAAGTTLFHRWPAGEWYVHLYGVYQRDGETVHLPKGLTRAIVLPRNQSVDVSFHLQRDAAEVVVDIRDGKPLKGAFVSVSTSAEVVRSGPDGRVKLLLGKGQHVVVVEARGMRVERTLEVSTPAPQAVSVDLIAERNREAGNAATT